MPNSNHMQLAVWSSTVHRADNVFFVSPFIMFVKSPSPWQVATSPPPDTRAVPQGARTASPVPASLAACPTRPEPRAPLCLASTTESLVFQQEKFLQLFCKPKVKWLSNRKMLLLSPVDYSQLTNCSGNK